MLIPATPEPREADSVSPALYEDLLVCRAKAAWDVGGDRSVVPPHPAQLLGVAFHSVLEAVHQGEISGDPQERREGARQVFDGSAAELYESAHPLVRVKFRSPERLPYYNQQRELAAMLAMETEGPQAGTGTAGGRRGGAAGGAEHWYVSEDGLIFGRPDFVDVAKREVIDYKTGHVGDGGALSDREKRQLALYAFLVQEAGIEIEKGRIVRADGEQAETPISLETAHAEAVAARSALDAYNVAAETAGFKAIASPSLDGCRLCECKPFCEAFWESAVPDWGETCGVHVEGLVVGSPAAGDVQGVEVLSLRLRSSRGTVPAGREVVIPQVPAAWFTADGDRVPQEGDVVRLVDGRRSSAPENETEQDEDAVVSEPPLVVNGDRVNSTFWRVEGAPTEGRI